ncbi:exonuclease SbcCD subunit D [Methyloversatilis sp.]|uniref:metallophosphoesterase family protein n=1 Tax=Methyloversatilis sp. TaxID=2569862 RepID=UPI0035B2B4B9
MTPYALMADVHLHRWTAFSSVEEDGVNSRLRILHREIRRAANEVRAAGGNRLIVAGDLFHVRGNIAPSVLNPTVDVFKEIVDWGIEVVIIPGNHDLEGKNSERIGSAVTSLEGVGCRVVNQPEIIGDVFLVPWFESIDDLKSLLDSFASVRSDTVLSSLDLILHAPIDGVITGLPDHGLTPEYLSSLGFRRVFAGHYHHSKYFGDGVYSIGALAHHSWSDVNTKAGFLIVGEEVRYMASHAPSFIDLDERVKEDEIPLLVDGHYVRVKVPVEGMEAVEAIRAELHEYGARGVIVQAVKAPVMQRQSSVTESMAAGVSIQEGVTEFVRSQLFEHEEEVAKAALQILSEVGA